MAIRLDKVVFTSQHEAFKNRSTTTASIVISGTIISGETVFSTTVNLNNTNAVTEIFVGKSTASFKTPLDNAGFLPDYTGADSAFVRAGYSGSTLTLTISVQNAGAPYVATTQTYNFTIVIFDAPLT